MSEGLRLAALRARIGEDPRAADLRWSLLVAAMSNYRHDSVLRPFPPMYLTQSGQPAQPANGQPNQSSSGRSRLESNGGLEEGKNYDLLKADAAEMPSLAEITSCAATLDPRSTELLHWTLDAKNFRLVSCDIAKYAEIESLTGQCVATPPPDYVFEVEHSASAEERFERARAGRDLMYAYHGSRTENFHSILHHGLNGHMSKNAVFGEGTYLSSELSVSLTYSPTGQGWGRSSLGTQLSCVAVCQLIDDPAVKCKIHDKSEDSAGASAGPSPGPASSLPMRPAPSPPSRGRIAGSMGGDVPEKYYVVRNDEVMRVKYVLVYARKGVGRPLTVRPSATARSCEWIRRHIYALILVLYAVLLLALGLYKSDAFRHLIRRHFQS